MFKVVVLISGRGSNLEALISKAGKAYEVHHVISSDPRAAGLEFAIKAKIGFSVVDRAEHGSKAEFQAALEKTLVALNPDLIVLAGFMHILGVSIINTFENKIINIHPSLLPAYPGLETHRRVIEAKEVYHGCSVHAVDAGVDTGKVIAQARLIVDPNDTIESLALSVLKMEHELLPWVTEKVASRAIIIESSAIKYNRDSLTEALEKGFIIRNHNV